VNYPQSVVQELESANSIAGNVDFAATDEPIKLG